MPERALEGSIILVTGVSRRRGIGNGIATALAAAGAKLFIHHYSPHDARQPWGADSTAELLAALDAAYPGTVLGDASLDLADPGGPKALVDDAVGKVGRLTGLVCNHAQSGGDGSIFDADEAMLDAHWHANARSVLLLTRYFAEQFAPDGDRAATAPGERAARVSQDEFTSGRVIWMTSGQATGPMPGEVAYAASKAAIAGRVYQYGFSPATNASDKC